MLIKLIFHFGDADLNEIRSMLPQLLDGMCVKISAFILYFHFLFGLVNKFD